MRPRQTVTDLFSSFIKFEQDTFKGWITAPKLRRSVDKILLEHPTTKNLESFLALYWHNLWGLNSTPVALEHLAAYLQEVCYWAAYKTFPKQGSSKYNLSDCFQIAIAQINTVLKGFDPKLGSNLKNYASVSFRSLLINTLRTSYEADLSSDWALLRKVSQRRLETCLAEAGLTPDKIAEYVLSWSCFKTIFVPTKSTGIRQISEPDGATWEKIAALYNKQCLQQFGTNCVQSNVVKIQSRLKNCVKCLRAYLFPQVGSLNAIKLGHEDQELIDYLPDTNESLLTAMIQEEETSNREQYQTQLESFLSQTLANLNLEQAQILRLYYMEGKTQTEIATQLETKQYNVSRTLTRARNAMLKALAKWSQEQFQVSLNTENLAQMDEVLEQWLENHYQQQGNKQAILS